MTHFSLDIKKSPIAMRMERVLFIETSDLLRIVADTLYDCTADKFLIQPGAD